MRNLVVCCLRQLLIGCVLLFAGCASLSPGEKVPMSTPITATELADLKLQVAATERAFAKTMADRDHVAFTGFLADDAIFFGAKVLRGKQAVADGWKRFFAAAEAPFSWQPADVEVLDSGDLALPSGPVRDGKGELIATFTSIWRREPSGQWRIVFDKGNNACEKCTK